jgi:hypothetical protein
VTRILLLLLVPALLPWAAASGADTPNWFEIASSRVRVLFEDPEMETYARRVAIRAEEALDELDALFGHVPPLTTISLDSRTDLYAAIAPPLPRPRVSLPALFPAISEVDLATADPLLALLLHELTHTVQLTFLERPDGVAELPRLGLVGESVAPLPPGWLLEGLAVWVAGSRAPGARVVDPRTRGVLESLALEGDWPTLAEVSLLSHRQWPGGEARYLLGGAFVSHLVDEFGWPAVLESLREANAGWYPMPFTQAWRAATGGDLEATWRGWSNGVLDRALERVAESGLELSTPLTKGGRASTVLAVAPDGERVAWAPAGGGLALARLSDSGLERPLPVLPSPVRPLSLDWHGPHTLVYARLAPGPDDRFVDLFELDLASGRETRLTWGERVRFPRSRSGGCVLYVRDVVGEGSSLRESCRGREPLSLFVAPEGSHIVGLDVSPGGRVVMSLWRNGFVDLALLEDGALRWLTQDAAQDLDPAWYGEDELLFRSDRSAVFEVHVLRPGDGELRRLTASAGGAFAPSAAGESFVYARLGGEGFDLAALNLAVLNPAASDSAASVPAADGARRALEPLPGPYLPAGAQSVPLESRPFDPSSTLAPYGWLPEFALVSDSPYVSGSVSLLGQDASGDHSYSLAAGFDPSLTGVLGGGWAALRYDYRSVDVLDLFQRPPPLGFGVRTGLWPHRPHLRESTTTASGVEGELRLRGPLGNWVGLARLQSGLVLLPGSAGVQPEGRVDLVASRRYADLWGYGTRGPRASLHGVWSAVAPGTGAAAGLWLDLSTLLPPSPVAPYTVGLGLRAGFRAPPPAPLLLDDLAASAWVSGRRSFQVGWRYADGLVALERLTVEGRLLAWYDASPAAQVGAGADVSLWADTMIRYGAPVSLGATVGHAAGWWYRLGVRLPL